jgi:hypothetical protein
VIHGIGHAGKLKKGSPPRDPDRITSMRLAADVK